MKRTTTTSTFLVLLVVTYALIAIAFAGCGIVPGVRPEQTHVDGTEEQPGPGSVTVHGDPLKATQPLVIQFVGHEGNVVAERTAHIPTGGVIEASMLNLPEVMTLLVNGTMCEGDFAIESDSRTQVVLRVSDAGCSVETRSTEPM
jgi:hypothetical protein